MTKSVDWVEFALNRIGKKPIYRIQGDRAFLEGGDFIPMRNYAMIGCGLRTTPAAICQLMENDLLGKDTLVVVRDAWKSQIQMHLDTYCNGCYIPSSPSSSCRLPPQVMKRSELWYKWLSRINFR